MLDLREGRFSSTRTRRTASSALIREPARITRSLTARISRSQAALWAEGFSERGCAAIPKAASYAGGQICS